MFVFISYSIYFSEEAMFIGTIFPEANSSILSFHESIEIQPDQTRCMQIYTHKANKTYVSDNLYDFLTKP